nr:alpha/beta hydrolases superfamily protein [Tanacetum cinerariifolium]
MAAGSRYRPPMLATGRYPQWRSRFLRYIDTRPNEKEAIHLILTGIGDEYTRLLMLAKQLRKYGKLLKGYNKVKKESSNEECLTFGSEDEEYAIANGKSDRKCFRCGDPNHLIGECPKPLKDKNQRAFVGGSWSDSGEEDDEKVKDETCLVAYASSEAHPSHKAKNVVSMTRCLELHHMDLFGPSAVWSYGGNRYTLVIVDDYSSKAYIVLNKHTKKVEESLNVTFDETLPPSKTSPLLDDDLDEEEAIKVIEKKNLENNIVDETLEIDKIVNIKESRNHPLENFIRKP